MIQIDMEMPQNCTSCIFFYTIEKENYEKHNFDESQVSFRCNADLHLRRIKSLKQLLNRPCDCPLKEVEGGINMIQIEEWKKDFKEYITSLSMPRDDYKGIMEYIDELPVTPQPSAEQSDRIITELEKITERINEIKGGNKYVISDYMCGLYKAFGIVDDIIADRIAELKGEPE